MLAKQETEKLMNAMLPFAEKMLQRYGEFYPYGGYLKPDGSIVDVGADDPDTARPKSRDLIHILRTSFREMAHAKQCKAVAIVFDVTVEMPSSHQQSDAIQVCVDHVDDYSAEVFFPYQIINNKIKYDRVFAQEGKHDIFERC